VAHAYNPSYSGGRDQQDHGLKPTQANTLRPYLKKKKKINNNKRAGGVAQGVGPDFKPSTTKKQKKVNMFILIGPLHSVYKYGNITLYLTNMYTFYVSIKILKGMTVRIYIKRKFSISFILINSSIQLLPI
jgi:hypothetical protein